MFILFIIFNVSSAAETSRKFSTTDLFKGSTADDVTWQGRLGADQKKGTEVKIMKISNGILAVLFLIGLGASSCATLRGPMTEEEEEEMVKTQNERWPQLKLSEEGGDND
jgi:hypothetical protein